MCVLTDRMPGTIGRIGAIEGFHTADLVGADCRQCYDS